ncbi:MAG: hypothetical protein ACXVZR_06900 [Terriglobales bacterium]
MRLTAAIPSEATRLGSAVHGPLRSQWVQASRQAFQTFASIAILLALASGVVAQAPPKPQPAPAKTGQAESTEHHITPEEAKELLNTVDEVLDFDSRDTGLRIKHHVKRQLADRDQVQKFIQARMADDEDTQRLRHSEVVLKKMGLLPRDFDLEKFLVELLREQVAGYYDTKTKTVYLLDWLPPASQLPVMAHELTHALQDQNFGMEKWVEKGSSGKTPAEEARSDEQVAARHAIIEGQAMAVMIDYLLAPTGNNIVNSPTIAEAIQQGMMEGEDSPVFNRAPLFLKRVLLFPYSYGLDFERELLAKGGKEKAFAGVFKSPPQNTRQVMEPATYLASEKLPELPVPDIAKLMGKDWEKYDVGSIGEFDVAVMSEIYGVDDPKTIYPHWRGGWYYAMKHKASGELAVVTVTKWATEEAATSFRKVCTANIPKRYKVTPGVPGGGAGGTPDGPAIVWTQWTTSDGPVALVKSGDMVISIESVPEELVAKVRDAVLVK